MKNMTFTPPPKSLLEGAVRRALELVCENVLTGCNEFVRLDQGQLQNSGAAMVEDMSIVVTYNTPYAKRVYYTGNPRKEKNANASLRWCEVAGATYRDEWKRAIEKGVAKNL